MVGDASGREKIRWRGWGGPISLSYLQGFTDILAEACITWILGAQIVVIDQQCYYHLRACEKWGISGTSHNGWIGTWIWTLSLGDPYAHESLRSFDSQQGGVWGGAEAEGEKEIPRWWHQLLVLDGNLVLTKACRQPSAWTRQGNGFLSRVWGRNALFLMHFTLLTSRHIR